jgi:hypothetical protein
MDGSRWLRGDLPAMCALLYSQKFHTVTPTLTSWRPGSDITLYGKFWSPFAPNPGGSGIWTPGVELKNLLRILRIRRSLAEFSSINNPATSQLILHLSLHITNIQQNQAIEL